MWLFIFFVVPHVILVFADGWDTLQSMLVDWSTKVDRPEVFAKEQSPDLFCQKSTLRRLGVRRGTSPPGKEWLLNEAVGIDDDVAEVL